MTTLQDTAAQLRCPSGEQAFDTAQKMNQTHGSLNRRCIELMRIAPGDRILETGTANGAFAHEIVTRQERVFYTGIDWSQDMILQARKNQAALIASGRADFQVADSASIPFQAHCFDKALTVHTIYFWDDPSQHLAEIARVLQPGGLLCLAFADREFTEKVAFGRMGFTLYRAQEAVALLQACGFQIQDVQRITESTQTEDGEPITKLLNIILASSPASTRAGSEPSGEAH